MVKRMNKIEKLIDELCPDGVELKSIGEICQISRGRVISKDYLIINAGEYPVYSSQTANQGIFGRINTYDYNGEYVTWTTDGANAGSVFYRNGKFSITNVCGLLKPKENNLDTKYLSYVLGITAKSYVSAGMGNPKLMSNVTAKIKIPIPPLAIQEEIIKILDNFTQLEEELEEELEARKRQYEHYRENLLTFDEREGGVRRAALSEITDFMNGKGHEKNIDENGEYIVVNSKFVSTEGKVKKYSVEQICPTFKKNILMVMSDLPNGRALAKCFYVDQNDKYTLNQRICALTVKDNDNLNAKYLFYILNRNKQLLRHDNGADQTNLRKNDILKIKIPVPEMSEQKRIVFILDKFDALVSDISIGLPAELNARKKQYEYYREKLLTFRENEHAK